MHAAGISKDHRKVFKDQTPNRMSLKCCFFHGLIVDSKDHPDSPKLQERNISALQSLIVSFSSLSGRKFTENKSNAKRIGIYPERTLGLA